MIVLRELFAPSCESKSYADVAQYIKMNSTTHQEIPCLVQRCYGPA